MTKKNYNLKFLREKLREFNLGTTNLSEFQAGDHMLNQQLLTKDERLKTLKWFLEDYLHLKIQRKLKKGYKVKHLQENINRFYSGTLTITLKKEKKMKISASKFAIKSDNCNEDLGVLLLQDIGKILENYNEKNIFSSDLVVELNAMEDRPWFEQSLGQWKLSRLLADFNIRSKQVRVRNKSKKGYRVKQLHENIIRYAEKKEKKMKIRVDVSDLDMSDTNNLIGRQMDLMTKDELDEVFDNILEPGKYYHEDDIAYLFAKYIHDKLIEKAIGDQLENMANEGLLQKLTIDGESGYYRCTKKFIT